MLPWRLVSSRPERGMLFIMDSFFVCMIGFYQKLQSIARKTKKNSRIISKRKNQSVLLDKLCEDIRGISYGTDMHELLVLMMDYHEMLYVGEMEKARILFDKFKALGSKMSETTNGVSFVAYIPDFEVRDVLKRSQLKEVYYRCLAHKDILEKE